MLLDLHHLNAKYNMNITGVIHIGAHFGQEFEEYNKIPSIRHVIAFEPHPKTFARLQETVKKYDGRFDNLITVNKGLGPISCRVDFHTETANEGQSSSVLAPKFHLEQYPGITFSEDDKIEINLEPLDKYEPSDVFNFINIDVQGFELQALWGARNTLANIDYIMAEVNRAELYEGCALVGEIDNFLKLYYNFDRVETSWAGGSWGDALYIKNNK